MFVRSAASEKPVTCDVKISNPDEIDLDEEEVDDTKEAKNTICFEQRQVPKEVFGGLVPSTSRID